MRGKEAIIVTEMPFQVYKGDGRGDGSGLMQKIAEQVQNGRLKEISTSATSPTSRASGS